MASFPKVAVNNLPGVVLSPVQLSNKAEMRLLNNGRRQGVTLPLKNYRQHPDSKYFPANVRLVLCRRERRCLGGGVALDLLQIASGVQNRHPDEQRHEDQR